MMKMQDDRLEEQRKFFCLITVRLAIFKNNTNIFSLIHRKFDFELEACWTHSLLLGKENQQVME